MSWISIEDVLRIMLHILHDENLHGPVNAVSPAPATNREFTQTLAGVLSRPAWLPAPAAALRMILGEMAEELLLSSTRVIPRRLNEAGYTFLHDHLESALRRLLGCISG